MTPLDWGVLVLLVLAAWGLFLGGLAKAHRQHRAARDRERAALKASAERAGRR